jgi:hypothetical protein
MAVPFREAVKAAGLDPETITPHVMRHTAITKLVQAGVDLPTVQRISGHRSITMVLRYTHVHGQHIDLAIQALGSPNAPQSWAEGFAIVSTMPPPTGFSANWRRIVDAAGRFLDQWAEAAEAAGWSTLDVFGCDPDRPAARLTVRAWCSCSIGCASLPSMSTAPTC